MKEEKIKEEASISQSSFYFAMRILPSKQSSAMFQVYAFCRAVDDIADSDLPRIERKIALDRWRQDIESCFLGRPPKRLAMLKHKIQEFDLQLSDFQSMIDGMAMDIAVNICAPDESTLDLYCDRVASSVGRLAVKIFGMQDGPGHALAHHLGRALQLTNILRDIDADAKINRCYLPRDILEYEGILPLDPKYIARHPTLPRVCAVLTHRAFNHFNKADEIMDATPLALVQMPRIMASVYRYILKSLNKSLRKLNTKMLLTST
ncbi:MAG: presqualene diphosphate synthase HpnD [Burkholderia sp.]|nr:presqualene diphosphate synthase HpnD [Burkholderia sp.]